MSIRKSFFALVVASAAIPAAFATSGGVPVGGEQAYEPHTVQGTASRSQVKSEVMGNSQARVASDRVRMVGGEIAYVQSQHGYSFEGGRLVHADNIAHDTPRPTLALTDAERRAERSYGGN